MYQYKILLFVIIFIFCFQFTNYAQNDEPSSASFSIERIAFGLNFPEGPAWDAVNSVLYISNCDGNWIAKYQDNKIDTFLLGPTEPIEFKKTNGLTVNNDGNIYACDFEKGAILKFSTEGKCEIVSPGFEGEKYNGPNDLAFDSKGNLFFTDPKSHNSNIRDGRIFMIPKENSRSKLLFDGLAFPNGLAFSPDGSKLYISESANKRILEFRFDKDGNISQYYLFYELQDGEPDGIAVDVEGNLYVASYGSGNIYVISPQREIIRTIKVNGKNPSNLEFGEADMKTLFITEDETNSVYKIRVEIPGLKLFSSP